MRIEKLSKKQKEVFSISESKVKNAIRRKKYEMISKGKEYVAWGTEYVYVVHQSAIKDYMEKNEWF